GLDFAAHELVRPVELCLKIRIGLEIPGHCRSSVLSVGVREVKTKRPPRARHASRSHDLHNEKRPPGCIPGAFCSAIAFTAVYLPQLEWEAAVTTEPCVWVSSAEQSTCLLPSEH